MAAPSYSSGGAGVAPGGKGGGAVKVPKPKAPKVPPAAGGITHSGPLNGPAAPKGHGASAPKGGNKGGGGVNPNLANWLAPMTNAQIIAQATQTIKKAYGPQTQDLNQQQSRAEALSAKRSQDNEWYQNWLNTQAESLQAHADAQNQAIVNATSGMNQAFGGLLQAEPQQLVADANSREGNVSNNAQSTAFNQDVPENAATAAQLSQHAATNLFGSVGSNNDMLNATVANNGAFIQAAQQKQIADLDNTLTTLAQDRAKERTSEVGDIAKEIARLQGVEIQKAQANRDYTATIQKLGLDKATLVARTKFENATLKDRVSYEQQLLALRQQGMTDSESKAVLAQMNSDRTFKLEQKRFGWETAKDQYERKHHLGIYKGSKGSSSGSGGSNPLTTDSINTIFAHLDTLSGTYKYLTGKLGLSPAVAQQTLVQGGHVAIPGTKRTYTVSAFGNSPLLDAAVGIAGTGLNGEQILRLEAMGIPLSAIKQRYQISQGTATPGASGHYHGGLGAVPPRG